MSNKHAEITDSQLHVAKGFADASAGMALWRNERGTQTFENINAFPKAIAVAPSNVAPPTEVNNAVYLLDTARGTLNVNTINWQSATTVRYAFSDTPDLSAYVVGDYITFKDCTNSLHNGTFVITAFNDGSDWIEISNPSVTDATNDEASSPGTATSTLSNWDGCQQNSWARYNSIDDKWYSANPVAGVTCFNTTLGYHMLFNGTEWVSLGSSSLTNVVYNIKITLSAAQLKTGNSVPIDVVVAPGAGKFTQAFAASFKYENGDGLLVFATLYLKHDTAAEEQLTAVTFNSALDGYITFRPPSTAQNNIVANKKLQFSVNADTGVGTGTAVLQVSYMIKSE